MFGQKLNKQCFLCYIWGLFMIIAQLSIAPLDKGISVSKYVKIVLSSIEKTGVKYKTNAMATVIETEDIDALLKVVKKAHNSLIDAGCDRVITNLKIDDRRDKQVNSEYKLASLK